MSLLPDNGLTSLYVPSRRGITVWRNAKFPDPSATSNPTSTSPDLDPSDVPSTVLTSATSDPSDAPPTVLTTATSDPSDAPPTVLASVTSDSDLSPVLAALPSPPASAPSSPALTVASTTRSSQPFELASSSRGRSGPIRSKSRESRYVDTSSRSRSPVSTVESDSGSQSSEGHPERRRPRSPSVGSSKLSSPPLTTTERTEAALCSNE